VVLEFAKIKTVWGDIKGKFRSILPGIPVWQSNQSVVVEAGLAIGVKKTKGGGKIRDISQRGKRIRRWETLH